MQFFEKNILLNFANMRKILWMVGIFLNSFAFAQISEDFSDGEMVHQPAWLGDTGRFVINSNLQLQSKNFFRGDTAYLSTASNYNLNAVWEFYLQMNFDPSTGNLFRYYFLSDNAVLNQSLRGYYLQIGESGSTDSYDFFRQTNSSSTKIIDGAPKIRSNVDTLRTFIRMVHDRNGNWYLYSRAIDSINWQLEGSTYDVTHAQANYTGLYIRHTSTRSDKFIFDKLHIQQYQPDTTSPLVVFANIVNDSTINIEFDESIDTLNVFNKNSYVLNNSIHPKSIIFNPLSNILDIVFSGYLPHGSNVLKLPLYKDLYGNIQSVNDSIVFNYVAPILSVYGDIIITEIMADPSPVISLPAVEYLEIHNQSEKYLPLNGFTISDGTSTGVIGNYSMAPEEFIILCRAADTSLLSSYGRVIGLSTWPSLNNASDILVLKNGKNEIIDQVSYDLSWYKDALKKDGGYSLEKVDYTNQCTAFYNWMASASQMGGTPGQKNSYWIESHENKIFKINHVIMKTDSTIQIQFNHVPDTAIALQSLKYKINGINVYAKEIRWLNINHQELELIYDYKFLRNRNYKMNIGYIPTCDGVYLEDNYFTIRQINLDDTSSISISEIMIDPNPQVSLPNLEYIEIYNHNNYDVYINNWKLKYNNSDFLIPNKKLLANEYYILCHVKDTLTFIEFGNTIGIISFPTLSNTGARIGLLNHKGKIVNEVVYDVNWHDEAYKKNGGWSLEQIDPYSKCNASNNWSSSKDALGGTPGYENSTKNFYSDLIDLNVLSIKNTNDKIFEIKFNKSFIGTGINPAQFYFVENKQNLYFPDSIQTSKPFSKTAKMYFSTAIPTGTYQVVCHSLSYCGRNDTNIYYKLEIREQSENDGIIISELMVDPSPSMGLPEAEYIEIHNKGNKKYDLHYQLYDKNNVADIYIDSIAANEYLILSDISYKKLWEGYTNVILINDMPSLNNSLDSIYLKEYDGKIIDSVFYNINQWHDDKRIGGYALELTENNFECKSNILWGNALNDAAGSPGAANFFSLDESKLKAELLSEEFVDNIYKVQFNQTIKTLNTQSNHPEYILSYDIIKNSIYLNLSPEMSDELLQVTLNLKTCFEINFDTTIFIQNTYQKLYQDIIINEVLFNSYAGSTDFIELYNNSDRAINLKGFSLKTKNESLKDIDSAKIFQSNFYLLPDDYLVITEDKQSVEMNYRTKNKEKIVEINKLIKMSDKEGNVYLLDETGKTLDQMNYSENMHLSWLEDIDGRSLERRRFDIEGLVAENWASASDDIGKASPGLLNSQNSYKMQDMNDEFYLSKKLISPNADGYSDLLELNYHLKNTSMIVRINVFDQQGRFVANIFNEYSISNEGILTWDMSQNNVKIQNGLYLIYIEGISDSGTYKKYKLPFIVDDN
jgi:hypothetical protein